MSLEGKKGHQFILLACSPVFFPRQKWGKLQKWKSPFWIAIIRCFLLNVRPKNCQECASFKKPSGISPLNRYDVSGILLDLPLYLLRSFRLQASNHRSFPWEKNPKLTLPTVENRWGKGDKLYPFPQKGQNAYFFGGEIVLGRVYCILYLYYQHWSGLRSGKITFYKPNFHPKESNSTGELLEVCLTTIIPSWWL